MMGQEGIWAAAGTALAAFLAAIGIRARRNGGGKTYRVELCPEDRERLNAIHTAVQHLAENLNTVAQQRADEARELRAILLQLAQQR